MTKKNVCNSQQQRDFYKLQGIYLYTITTTTTTTLQFLPTANMSKQLPNTREEAFAYQFEDDVKKLHSLSLLSKDAFKKHLAILQAHIDAYNNLDLQKSCEEAERKHIIQKQYMLENYGL